MVKFRQLGINDVSSLTEIERVCFGQDAWSYEMIIENINSPTTTVVGATDGDRIVAALSYSRVCDEAHINNIMVLPEMRKQGIGGALIEQLISSGVKVVSLEVDVNNTEAIRLYERYGFEKVSVRKGYYTNGNDAYLMVYTR